MNEDFLAAMTAIEKEKGVKKGILFDAIEAALVSAYKRNFNTAANVRVQLNRESGEIKVFTRLVVVAEVFQAQMEISLSEVREIDSNYQLGDIVEKEVTPKNFGRIAAQTAKQVVIQRIREAEREMVFDEYVDREEDIITGIVQRIEQKNVIVDLGKTEAVLSPTEQMPSDEYKQGERVKAYINEVRKTTKGPQIFISRTHPGLLKRLFELEVPEIFDGTVEIKAVAREAGYRSKLAVYSKNRDVDPVGACVGPKGARVQAIVDELRGEKIDIVKWDENPEIFVANALSPAKVVMVSLQSSQKVANVIVPDYQLSLAIGKEGQNARLAAKLTNWKIDIASESQAAERAPLSPAASERLPRREQEFKELEISGVSGQGMALGRTTLAKGVTDDETP
ncbi:MAG: transcription termination/antitermination protein NusA [Dethiobacter sp.]|jgi:N utilization substance protein A|nr:transcription termination/antitermination protein NusA [Dethiobacter sp.]MBS3900656.1 transcription termination/antitermination protein NusA [Dethiobacter sp.]MBS3989622.1 transcription termination/antitermination protein NusA [Dethiobacter sp.]